MALYKQLFSEYSISNSKSIVFHEQAGLGGLPGTDSPHMQKEKQGDILREDPACGKRQMLSQYGIIVTYELASHLSWIKRREGEEHSLHCERG